MQQLEKEKIANLLYSIQPQPGRVALEERPKPERIDEFIKYKKRALNGDNNDIYLKK